MTNQESTMVLKINANNTAEVALWREVYVAKSTLLPELAAKAADEAVEQLRKRTSP